MPIPKLSDSNLGLVSHNLQSLFAAAHDTRKQTIELIPSFFGHKLFTPVSWKGRILRILHACLAFIVSHSFVKNKLAKSLKVTQECFSKLENFRHQYHDVVYADYLNSRFQNMSGRFTNQEVNHSRKQIRAFYQATYPLTQLVRKQSNDCLNNFLKEHFKELYERGETPFYSETTFKAIKDYIRIMSIEGYAHGELPLSIFKKISAQNDQDQVQDNTTKVNEKALVSFVKKMLKAKKQGNFQIENFHRALRSLIHHLKQHQHDNIYDLKLLGQALIKEDGIFLYEFEKKHIEWREKLRKGDSFIQPNEPFYYLNDNFEKYQFALGNLLKGREKSEDCYQVYEIYNPNTFEKYENLLMVTGPNKICLEYSDIMRLESFWGLETPKIHYIHPKGKYAIIERLPHPIESILWTSDLIGDLAEADKQYADPLRILIQFFIDEKNTPKDLKTEYLRFDSVGRLKSTKDCIPCGRIDYMGLEEMTYKLAQGKYLPIYQYLTEPIRNEKYCKKKLMPFFQEAITSAFEKKIIKIDLLAKKRDIEDQAIIDRAERLQKLAIQMKEDCYKMICDTYYPIDKEKLRTHMSKCLLKLYNNGKTLGRFWDNLQSADLIEEVEKDLAAFAG